MANGESRNWIHRQMNLYLLEDDINLQRNRICPKKAMEFFSQILRLCNIHQSVACMPKKGRVVEKRGGSLTQLTTIRQSYIGVIIIMSFDLW